MQDLSSNQISLLKYVTYIKRSLTYTPYAAQAFFARGLLSLETNIFKNSLVVAC